jgi:hypothetical protein
VREVRVLARVEGLPPLDQERRHPAGVAAEDAERDPQEGVERLAVGDGGDAEGRAGAGVRGVGLLHGSGLPKGVDACLLV